MGQHTLSFCHILIHHGTDATVRPYVLCSLYHIYNGIDRQNDAHDADWNIHARHQGKGEEIATHRNARIAHGRQYGDKEPEYHRWQ